MGKSEWEYDKYEHEHEHVIDMLLFVMHQIVPFVKVSENESGCE